MRDGGEAPSFLPHILALPLSFTIKHQQQQQQVVVF
jgi:hypothetical protein